MSPIGPLDIYSGIYGSKIRAYRVNYLPLLRSKTLPLSKSFLPDFIKNQMYAGQSHGTFQAFAICMDLSGFTQLTAKLMEKGSQGAEELSHALNAIFEPMVQAVYAEGGFIPYFAGDSFTGVFVQKQDMAETGLAILRIAHEISERFKPSNSHKERIIGQYQINVKMGLSYGQIEWGIVGKKRKSFYFRGEAIDFSAQAQMLALRGETYAHQSVFPYLQQYLSVGPSARPEYSKVLNFDMLQVPMKQNLNTPSVNVPADMVVLEQYFPKEILIQTDVTGEFRNVTTVFIAFGKCEDHHLLDQFAALVLDQSLEFSGYFKEIDHGDKGGLICVLFGAPVAFENNTERAIEFALAIEDELKHNLALEGLIWRIGMSSGTAFTGMIGGAERSQYAAVGARVNLAARLMASAKWGQMVTDENVQRNRNYRFEPLGEQMYKGFSVPITSFLLEGRNQTLKTGYSGHYVGRQEELQTLLAAVEPLRRGQFAGVTLIFGEPGIGKSRLSWEFRKAVSSQLKIRWMVCRSDQILRKPFNPFLLFLKNYFDLKGDQNQELQTETFLKNFDELCEDLQASGHPMSAEINADLVRLQYVLIALAGIKDPNSPWSKLEGRTRYQLAFQALSVLITAEACIQPVVIELEDAHWYDDMSKEFLQDFVRKALQFPILFHVSSRYEDDGSKVKLFQPFIYEQYHVPSTEIDLKFLSQRDMAAFAESRLNGEITDELSDLLYRMSQGNPFYAEQLVEYFKETNLLTYKKNTYGLGNTDIRISESVKEIMIARIDRLSGLVKETVKAAAVIGREFEVDILSGVMAKHMEFIKRNGNLHQVLNEQIKTAEQGQIWHAINELRYIFKHSLLREAAYDMQLHTRLRDLHLLIAQVIETQYPDNEERYFDLAFHYEQAGAHKPMEKYLDLAGRYAQKNFQNGQALLCFDKLLELAKGSNRKRHIKIWLRKGAVHELIGQWDMALESYETALIKSMDVKDAKLMGRSYRRLGQLLMLKGEYERARQHFEQAISQFAIATDMVGTAKTLGNMGALFFRQGMYEDARKKLLETIELNRAEGREVDNAPFVANLGLVAMNQSNYDEAIRRLEYQIDVNEAAGDKQGLTTLYTNLGIIYLEKNVLTNARLSLEKGLAISEELDNKLYMTICTGSLGRVWEQLGDTQKAMQLYDRDIALVLELGDKQGLAIAYNLKGELLSKLGQKTEALDLLQQSIEIARQLNYRKGLAKAVNAIGDLYFSQGDLPKAESSYLEALSLAEETGYKLLQCETYIELGEVYCAFGKYDTALQQYQNAVPMAEALAHPNILFSLGLLGLHLLVLNGQKEYAQNELDRLKELYQTDEARLTILQKEEI
jgi:tetratricopeptide (TPR) repeat protein/class 3 adenylate cyclase